MLVEQKINCPNDPPAFINPPANDLFSLGRFFAVAPINIEKLPAPAPAATRRPKVRIIENSEVTKGVNIKPKNINKAPKTKTPKEPFYLQLHQKLVELIPK